MMTMDKMSLVSVSLRLIYLNLNRHNIVSIILTLFFNFGSIFLYYYLLLVLRGTGSVYYVRNVDTPTSEPSVSMSPSSRPSDNPSAVPSTSMPSQSPVTSVPTANPSTSPPSYTPSIVPTMSDPSLNTEKGSDSEDSSGFETLYIILIIIFGGAMVVFLSIYLYGILKRLLERKLESNMNPDHDPAPVTAEVQVIPPLRSQESVVTPRNNLPNIASVFAIEQITPSPKKKKKKKKNNNTPGTGTSSSSVAVAAVLPFATHVSDHIPVAELEEMV